MYIAHAIMMRRLIGLIYKRPLWGLHFGRYEETSRRLCYAHMATTSDSEKLKTAPRDFNMLDIADYIGIFARIR